MFGNFLSHFGQISNRNIGHFVKHNKSKFRVYLGVRTREVSLCFVAIVIGLGFIMLTSQPRSQGPVSS